MNIPVLALKASKRGSLKTALKSAPESALQTALESGLKSGLKILEQKKCSGRDISSFLRSKKEHV